MFLTYVISLFIVSSSFCEQKKFEESFVDLRVSQNVNDSYYKIYVDEKENPYINVKNFFTDYLGFSETKCDVLKFYCETKMPPNDTLFWIDGRSGEFGNAESSDNEKFDKSSIAVIKKEIWIRYDVIAKWIPIDGEWSLDAYILTMNPKFKLIFDKKVERQELIKKLTKAQLKKDIEQKADIIYPEKDFNAVARYRWGLSVGTQSSSSTSIDYDVTLDFLGGTGVTGQSFAFPLSGKRVISTPYGTYSMRNKKHFALMEFGTTTFDMTPLLLSSVKTDYGFRFDSRDKSERREGNINITDLAPKGTEVDLYINGYYISTVKVADDGRYSFPEVIASGSDSVLLKIYYPNGLEEEKKIDISKDGGNRLPKGEFEERVYVGKGTNNIGNFYFTSLRYGLLHNLTLGVSPMFLPNQNHVTPLIDTYFMPFYWINFLGQAMISSSGIDRAFDVNLGLLQPHFIQLEHKFYNFGSPALNVSSSSSTSDIGETWSLKHQVNLSPWSLSESFTQTEKQRVISGAIRRPLINKITASVAGNISFYRGMDITTYSAETGLDFPLYDGKFSVSRHWMSGLSQNDFSYDIRGTNSVEGLDLRFRLSLSDKGDKSFSAEANYRAAENIKLTLSIQSQSVIGTFSWNGVIGGKNSSSLWDKYDTGTVSGQIFDTREKGVNGKGIPMSGVLLQVGSESATTNDDGFFRVTNIPPDVPITARVDANSLDGTLAPEHEKDFMYLRKASHISWNPKIVPTIGLDGYLDATGGYEEGVKIEAMRLSDYVVVASSEVDSSDGFFVLEKLTPGKYQLSLNWPGRKIKPIEVTIKKNAEWITGARWDIDEATFEFAKGTQAAESRVLDKAIAPKTGGKSNKEEKDAVPVKIIATKEVELANKLRGLQNIIQIKLHSAEISKDEDAKKRIDTYKRLISITDKIESDWANISEQKKEESIVKIKKLLTSKNLAQDEINVELLKKLRLDLSNRVEKLRSRPTAKTIKKVDIYMRLDKIIEALQKDWDKLSLDERATKIDGIKKIFLGMEKQ